MADIGGPAGDEALADDGPDIEIADPAVPPLAVRVIIGPGGWQLAPFGGAQVLLDGQPAGRGRVLAARPAGDDREHAARAGAV